MNSTLKLGGLFVLSIVNSYAFSATTLEKISERPIVKKWSNSPMLTIKKTPSRKIKTIVLNNISSDSLQVFPASQHIEEDKFSATVKDKKAPVQSQGAKKGGYHWLMARQENQQAIRTANTVIYFANPSPTPRDMINFSKSEFEIKPVELPREHRHFRANESYTFKVLFNGKPLSDIDVIFQSKNGSQKQYISNQKGLFDITFPDDFSKLKTGHEDHQGHAPKQADFVISAKYSDANKRYLSSFNYHYRPDAFLNKSLFMGLGFGLFGMLAAAPLVRHKQKEKKA